MICYDSIFSRTMSFWCSGKNKHFTLLLVDLPRKEYKRWCDDKQREKKLNTFNCMPRPATRCVTLRWHRRTRKKQEQPIFVFWLLFIVIIIVMIVVYVYIIIYMCEIRIHCIHSTKVYKYCRSMYGVWVWSHYSNSNKLITLSCIYIHMKYRWIRVNEQWWRKERERERDASLSLNFVNWLWLLLLLFQFVHNSLLMYIECCIFWMFSSEILLLLTTECINLYYQPLSIACNISVSSLCSFHLCALILSLSHNVLRLATSTSTATSPPLRCSALYM